MPDTEDSELPLRPLRWSRRYLRAVRESHVDAGGTACSACGTTAQSAMEAALQPGDAPINWGGSPPHPSGWLSLNERPALVWHGSPDDGEHHMFISGYCKRCYTVVMYESGSRWSENHRDLTRLSDEEQDAADRE